MITSEYRELLYPCNLWIKLSLDMHSPIINHLKEFINLAFDSFFYNIFISNWSIDLKKINNFGRLESTNLNAQIKDPILIFPTYLFYKSLNEEKKLQYQSAINLGITHLPLYSSTKKNLLFLYGEAYINRKCAVVSSFMLNSFQSIITEGNITFEKRIIKECIHEIGHIILGNSHCMNSECVMNYSTNLKEVDEKKAILCDSCFEKIERIREDYNF